MKKMLNVIQKPAPGNPGDEKEEMFALHEQSGEARVHSIFK